jgi:hypothetical protein
MRQTRINPVVLLIIALPLAAVVASVGTAVLAVSRGDPPLPDQYHWEGDKLDHDFAQSRRAAQLNVHATLDLQPQHGVCHLALTLDGTPPSAVDVALIHVSKPALDRHLRFLATAVASVYSAPCAPLAPARWHVELSDPINSWSFRSAAAGQLKSVTLSANSPADGAVWP